MPWISSAYFNQLTSAQQQRLLATHVPLGENPNNGDSFLVPVGDFYGGVHTIGVQGTGKSRFLEGLIHHDIAAGHAVIVLDPHGDLADNCLAALPESALERTSVLDMAQEEHPFGANLFAQGTLNTQVARAQAKERITHVFDVFWPEVMKQQYVPLYLSYAIPVMLDNPDTTLLDLRRFLMKKDYRAQLLKAVREPSVRDFWQREYDPLKPETRLTRTRPLLNRLHLLTASPLLRNIICQPAAIDFRRAIEQKEVLFIKLPTTTMATDAAMVGMILMGQIDAATFSFGNVPAHKRPGFSLYADEFQTVATPDFEKLYSQGRKFGLRMVVAHQRRDQLSPELQKATLSARTTVVFRVTVDDSKKLSQLFPVSASRPKPEDIQLYPCDYLISHTHLLRDPGVLAFTEDYLLPLQTRNSRGQVVITDAEYRTEEFFSSGHGLLNGALYLGAMLNGMDSSKTPVRVPDPTPHLDMLLREVMVTNNPRLPIPPEAVRGLANGGGGFFPAVRNLTADSPVLRPQWTPPAHLIRVGADGWEVLRAPEGPTEWLAHCIFMLRATLVYLAEHPLGNAKETGASEIASRLVRLPKRIAFVRSGDDVGPIRTFDAPEPVAASEQEWRLGLITWQSRQRYCRPREDVESAFSIDEPEQEVTSNEHLPTVDNQPVVEASSAELPEEPAISRWEL